MLKVARGSRMHAKVLRESNTHSNARKRWLTGIEVKEIAISFLLLQYTNTKVAKETFSGAFKCTQRNRHMEVSFEEDILMKNSQFSLFHSLNEEETFQITASLPLPRCVHDERAGWWQMRQSTIAKCMRAWQQRWNLTRILISYYNFSRYSTRPICPASLD